MPMALIRASYLFLEKNFMMYWTCEQGWYLEYPIMNSAAKIHNIKLKTWWNPIFLFSKKTLKLKHLHLNILFFFFKWITNPLSINFIVLFLHWDHQKIKNSRTSTFLESKEEITSCLVHMRLGYFGRNIFLMFTKYHNFYISK